MRHDDQQQQQQQQADRRSDDRSRFVVMYHRHYADILRYAQRRIGSESAQDVAAETFLIAWRRLDDVPTPALPWLYGVARLNLANHHRSNRREHQLDARMQAATAAGGPVVHRDLAEEVSDRVALADLLGRLPPRDREALQLIAWENLKLKEAAAVAGCSVTAMAMRVHRARRRFQKLLHLFPLGATDGTPRPLGNPAPSPARATTTDRPHVEAQQ